MRQQLPSVYWDWNTLTDSQRAWVSSHGADKKSWKSLALKDRQKRLDGWAQQESDALMKLNPSTPGQVEEMGVTEVAGWGIEGSEKTQTLQDRYSQAKVAVDKLAQARLAAANSSDPSVRQALADAQNAPDVDARLSALSRVFDGLGQRDAAVLAAAPPVSGQVFDARTRRVTADLLSSGLMREIQGTWAGQDLSAFFANHPLNIVVAPTQMSAVAWYKNDVLSFNEQFIQEFVQARGKTIDDLAKDRALLGDLIHEVAPIFVHESTHQMQDTWARQPKIPFYGGEGPEEEAMTVEALYVLQKEKLDPCYSSFLAANAASRSTWRG